MKFSESNKCIVHREYKTVLDVGKDARKAWGPFSIKSIAAVPVGLFG